MWIASTLGYFSIVKKRDGFHVRARSSGDLAALQKRHAQLRGDSKMWPILETPENDYCARMIVDEKTKDDFFDILADSIDYPNFKSMIHESPTQCDKLPWYSMIWRIMHGYQYGDAPVNIEFTRTRHERHPLDTSHLLKLKKRGAR